MKKTAQGPGSPKDSHYARLRRQHRDSKVARSDDTVEESDRVLLYGLHTVRAAIDNPKRTILRLKLTQNALKRLGIDKPEALPFPVEMVSPSVIDRTLPADAIHQGALLETEPLPVAPLNSLERSNLILVLDQITDPHNVGAIMRSAVAFQAGAVITTRRHSPQESGVLAKSASGALELIPFIQVTNLAEAIDTLNDLEFLTIGLDSEGPGPLEDTFKGSRIALVLGAEGKGLRQKTRSTVQRLARLDMPGSIKSLNVSNAAAIALYAAHRHLNGL